MIVESLNIPCQVCSVTSTQGVITPIWCRFRDEEGEVQKLTIEQAVRSGPEGIQSLFFDCSAVYQQRKIQFTLRMDDLTHKWSIVKKSF